MTAQGVDLPRKPPSNLGDFRLMTRERWDALHSIKSAYFAAGDPSVLASQYLCPEIAASWQHCYQSGLHPSHFHQVHFVDTLQYAADNPFYNRIVDALQSMVAFMQKLPPTLAYHLALDNSYGISLYKQISYTDDMQKFGKRDLATAIADEQTGTTSHFLCKTYNKPIQLQGPEHLFSCYDHVVATSAPIHDMNDNFVAALGVFLPMVDKPWDKNFQTICALILVLISSMASAIENQIRAVHEAEQARRNAEEQRTILSIIDEGIFTLDQHGKVSNINSMGSQMLGIGYRKNTENFDLAPMLKENSQILESIRAENSADLEETIETPQGNRDFEMMIRPLVNRNPAEKRKAVVRLNTIEKLNIQAANRYGASAHFSFNDIIGNSAPMRDAIRLGKIFAKSPGNILLTGESGTGKELFAQAIHNQWNPAGPFVAVNCAAIPRALIESELFGYEAGAFTGANKNGQPGKIELANGGTLFLDEIGDMPIELQVTLLRVLQDQQVMRVGGHKVQKVAFKLIAASHKNLGKLISTGLFRDDLYYRLSVFTLPIPPLRARDGDIALLWHYFIGKYSNRLKFAPPEIADEVIERIHDYPWPGNVRQLENAAIYALNIAVSGHYRQIQPRHLPSFLLPSPETNDTAPENQERPHIATNEVECPTLREAEKAAIRQAMKKADNHIPCAAQYLGVSKSTLYRKLRAYNCTPV